jgi:ABC-type multidrug transport system ATPase subunit
MSDAYVEMHRVSKTFGAIRALVGVSVRFEAGRVGVVEGPNGAGKSTLLAVAGTLVRSSSGRVDYGALGRRRGQVRRSLGWLGNDSLCYPDLTGRENLELAARLYGLDVGAAVVRASERFGLEAFVGRAVRTYSRGQRQRLALARALVHRPQLLLLDEPTTGLDSVASAELCTVVREEAVGGAVVVVVTHDRGFALAVGDDRFEMHRGRLVS